MPDTPGSSGDGGASADSDDRSDRDPANRSADRRLDRRVNALEVI